MRDVRVARGGGRRKRRGIDELIAALVLVGIVVATGILVYHFSGRSVSSRQVSVYVSASGTVDPSASKAIVKVFMRNTGSVTVKLLRVSISPEVDPGRFTRIVRFAPDYRVEDIVITPGSNAELSIELEGFKLYEGARFTLTVVFEDISTGDTYSYIVQGTLR